MTGRTRRLSEHGKKALLEVRRLLQLPENVRLHPAYAVQLVKEYRERLSTIIQTDDPS